MSARRRGPFPLKTPLFDVGTVTITKKAKALLEKQGVTVYALLNRFRRLDWPWPSEDGDLGWGQNVEALRGGKPLFVTWGFGAPLQASRRHIAVECTVDKTTIIETCAEYLYRTDPKHRGPEDELPEETWGKGVYTPLPVEIVKVAGSEETGA